MNHSDQISQLECEEHTVLDATGLLCPEPVMLLHKQVKLLEANCIIKVIADDPSTQRDIPRFCQFLRHDLVASQCGEVGSAKYVYWIRTRTNAGKN